MKSIFKVSINEFKKKFYLFLIIEIVYLILLFVFLSISKATIYNLSSLIQGNANVLQNINTKDVKAIEEALNMLTPLLKRTLFFIYGVVPFGLFTLFLFSRYFVFNLIKKRKLKDYFLIILPFFSLMMFSLIHVLLGFKDIIYGSFNLLKLVLFLLLLLASFYLMFIGLCLDKKDVYKKIFMKLKKSYLYFPLFLIYLFIILIIFFFFFGIYFSLQAGLIKLVLIFLILEIIFLLLLIWYRLFLILSIEKD